MSQLTTSRTRIQTQPILPAILEEIETFEQEAKRMLSGEIVGDLFKPFRLQYGIYGQRQAGVQMVRIKIPFPAGRLSWRNNTATSWRPPSTTSCRAR